jgi:hypothetical protein
MDGFAEPVVEIHLFDAALILAHLTEAHEDLCRIRARSGWIALDEPLEHLRSVHYLLTGE